jgi:hypothetical protein
MPIDNELFKLTGVTIDQRGRNYLRLLKLFRDQNNAEDVSLLKMKVAFDLFLATLGLKDAATGYWLEDNGG